MKDLESKNLIIRKFKVEDVNDQFNVVSNKEVAQYSDYKAYETLEETLVNIKSAIQDYDSYDACWAIEEKTSSTVIGHIRILGASLENKKCILMWSLGKEWWGLGYSEEVLKTVMNYLFNNHPIELISVEYYANNPHWAPILEKIGMKKDARLRRRKIDNTTGEYIDLLVYSILKEELK